MNKYIIHLMAQMIFLFLMICLIGDSATIPPLSNGFIWVSSWCKHVATYCFVHPLIAKWQCYNPMMFGFLELNLPFFM
jgi:hypothetical protein